MVNWDQRASGKTFLEIQPESVAKTLHISRYTDDTIEVAELIRSRYRQNKIILMGHSWGTIIGLQAALKRPDLFYAYVGIGQVINTRDNERLSFDYALTQAKAHKNTQALAELETIDPYPGNTPITRERIIIARKWAQFYGGLSAHRPSSDSYFNAPLLSPDYSEADRRAIDEGNKLTLGRILPEFLDIDFNAVRRAPLPIVMFMGRHDYNPPSEPTSAWMVALSAPYKKSLWFERSAHMLPWEEPGKLLVSLLTYVQPLAVAEKRGVQPGVSLLTPDRVATDPGQGAGLERGTHR